MRAYTVHLLQLVAWALIGLHCARASGRDVLVEPAVADPVAATASEPADGGLVDTQAVPDVIRCKWRPNVYPKGYTRENWTATWPFSCQGTPVGDPCKAVCKPGYRQQPPGNSPTVYCGPPKYKFGVWDNKVAGGWCKPIPTKPKKCSGSPQFFAHARWVNCSNELAGTNCTAVCDSGYTGDPAPPQAVCVLDKSGQYARWTVVNQSYACVDSTVCRTNPCSEIAFAISDSCVPNYEGTDFTCTCFDYYRWDSAQNICVPAELLAFAVAAPVDGAPRSYIYKYGAQKATDIGKAKWILQDSATSVFNLYDVAIADSTTAWAVGANGLIKKYDGTGWSIDQSAGSSTPDLLTVAAMGKSRAWVGGANGYARHWDGTTWSDASVEKGRSINSIATAADADGKGQVAWAVAGDERDPNNLSAYVYKWDFAAKKWQKFQSMDNITLRGVTALDKSGAWACGFTNKGNQNERAVVLVYDPAADTWNRVEVKSSVNGYARLNDIVAIDYRRVYAAGYWESASAPVGNEPHGLVMEFDGVQWNTVYNGNVYKFDAIAGISPSTTVAVGQFNEQAAIDFGWGYPAENWQKYRFQDRAIKNGSVAKDLGFSGIGMKYV